MIRHGESIPNAPEYTIPDGVAAITTRPGTSPRSTAAINVSSRRSVTGAVCVGGSEAHAVRSVVKAKHAKARLVVVNIISSLSR